MTRRTIHLCDRHAKPPLRCLACGEVAANAADHPELRGRGPAICVNARDWTALYRDHPEYHRCIDPLTALDKLPKPYPVPTEPGYYWAEWRIQEEGTFPNPDDYEPNTVPEVVHVYDADRGADHYVLIVDVHGYATEQSLDNFVWRSGRLEVPKR